MLPNIRGGTGHGEEDLMDLLRKYQVTKALHKVQNLHRKESKWVGIQARWNLSWELNVQLRIIPSREKGGTKLGIIKV